MAEQNPPLFIQGQSHPGEDIRRWIATHSHQAGIVGSGDLKVTEKSGTPNMSVDVAGGRAFIAGTEATYQGSYEVENRGTKNLTITAADPTNPRKDLIVAKVQDANYSGAVNAWSLAVVTGTPAGSPSEPSAPNNSIVLAMVDVPAASTSVINSRITNRRTYGGQPWSLPWGVPVSGAATISANQTGIGAGPTDLTNFTATITAVAGRRHIIRASGTMFLNASGGWQVHVLRNGVDIGRLCVCELAASGRVNLTGNVVDTGYSAGSVTYKLTATRYSGASTIEVSAATVNAYFTVEDAGPASVG